MRFIAAWLVLSSAVLAWAQGNTAIVTGADHVFIRRGPGTGFPPFATLTQGATVEIQELQGEWARVTTASGQSGYVNSNFLSLPGEHSASAPAATPAPTPARPAPAAPAPAPVEAQGPGVRTLMEQNKGLNAEVRRLQEELAALKSREAAVPTAPTATTPAVNEFEKLHADLARLSAAVEQLQRRTDVDVPVAKENAVPLAPPPLEGNPRVTASTVVLLAAVSLCIGWLLGNTYGRRQERGRRPRVRL